MIKFFRKIRYDLMEKNKTGKYLKYAIGEIVLVVIGILIALSINNWNEHRITYNKQKKYLQLIKVEMTSNLATLIKEKEDIANTMSSAIELIITMNANEKINSMSEQKLSSLLAGLMRYDINIFLENGAMNQIISVGLKDIENDSIRTILAAWDGQVSRVKIQEQAITNYQTELRNHLRSNGQIRTVFDNLEFSKRLGFDKSSTLNSNKHLLKSKIFENNVLFIMASGKVLKEDVYPEFENKMRTVINLIDQELKLNK